MSSAPEFLDPILTSLRENRLVMERLVQWKGVEPGMIHSVTDAAVFALALGLLAHDVLPAELDRLTVASGPVAITETDGGIRIDAGGRHAWAVAEPVLDIAIDAFRRAGTPAITVVNLVAPALIAVVEGIAQKHDLDAAATVAADGSVRITVTARDAATPTVLDRIRRHGVPARRADWFELFRLSSNALAEDTPVSRTHTGSFMVRADGTIVGRNDNENAYEDVTLLTAEKLEYRR